MSAMTASIAGMVGSITQIAGTLDEASSNASAMKYNAAVAANDAKMAEKAKGIELHKSRTARRKLLARQNAVIAASGRDYSGSPLDIIAQSESAALLDESIIRMNADMKIGRLYGQAALDRGSATSALNLGRAKAGRQLFSSASKFAMKGLDSAKSRVDDRSVSESGTGRIVT